MSVRERNFILPVSLSVSYSFILYFSKTANPFFVGLSNLVIMALNAVPATVPFNPALANAPIAAAASLNDTFAILIIGAANFIASPISNTLVLVLVVTLVRISAICGILELFKP